MSRMRITYTAMKPRLRAGTSIRCSPCILSRTMRLIICVPTIISVISACLRENSWMVRSCSAPQFDGSQDHDMILRLTDRAKCVVHVPKLLYYWRCHPGSVASGVDAKPYVVEAAKGAVADHLRRHGFKHFQITIHKGIRDHLQDPV